ncbi:hypothetical protein CCL21_26730, partial [Pseudomonas syringae]
LTLQRGNAFRDALRHRSASHRTLKAGRGASRTACDAERRTIVTGERPERHAYAGAGPR